MSSMLLSSNKERAILEWVNCLSLGNSIESLEELMDGKFFLDVMNSMETKHNLPRPDNVRESFDMIAKFLDDYYQTSTKSLIRYRECWKGKKFELAKVAVLLLSAHILLNLTSSSQNAVGPLTNLDESIQMEIRECLQAVVNNQDGISLGAEFVTVLSQHLPSPEKIACGSQSSSVYENNTPILHNQVKRVHFRNRLSFSDSPSVSPLKDFLDSPQMVAKAAGKEMESLRSRLLSEQLRTTDLETELQKLHDEVDSKVKEVEELRKIVAELRQYQYNTSSLEEYKTLAEQHAAKIEKLSSEVKELELYKNTNSYLETENKNLLEAIEKLEQNVRCIENLHKTISQLSQQNHSLADQLKKEECLNIDYKSQISCLHQDLLSARKELDFFQQLNKEKMNFSKLSNASSSESYDSGECLMTAVTEIELSELKSQFSEVQEELQKQKEEYNSVLHKNYKLSDSVAYLKQNIKELANDKSKLEEEMANKLLMQEEVNRTLSTDCQKIREENGSLQSILDCLQKTNEKLHGKITALSSENNNIQQAYCRCSAELETIKNELKETTSLCEVWKQKSLSFEEKYNNAVQTYSAREEALHLEAAEIENKLKICIAEKESELLSANATELSLDNIIKEKEAKLKEVETCYSQKVKEVEEKSSIIERVMHEKEMLNHNIAALQEVMKSSDNTIGQLSAAKRSLEEKLMECSKLKAYNESYQREITGYEDKLSDLKTNLSCLEKENSELTERLKELDKRFQDLEKNAEDVIKEKKLYQDNYLSLKTDFDKLALKLNEAEKENLNLRNDMRNLHATYCDQVQQSVSYNQDLKRVIAELNETLDSKSQEIISCKKALEEEKAKHEVEISALNKSLKSAEADVEMANVGLEATTTKCQEEISNMKRELNEKEKVICELNQELLTKNLEIKKVEMSRSKMELLENDHQKLIEKLEDLERILRNCKEAKELAEKEYYLCVEQKEKDKENMRNQLSQLQKETEKQNKEYNEKITHLNNILETSTKSNEEQTSKLRNEIELLKNENCHLISESRILEDKTKELEVCQAEVERLNAQINLLKEESEHQKSLHNSAIEELRSENQLCAEKGKQAEEEIALLKNSLSEKCHLLTEKNERIIAIATEINKLKEEICTLMQNKKELLEALSEKETACNKLAIDIQETKLQKQSVESELLKLNEEITSSHQRNEALRKQVVNMENTINSKDTCIENLTAENELLLKEIKLQKEIYVNSSGQSNDSLPEQNSVDMNNSINVNNILERVENIVQNINDTSKTELLSLITELKEKLNFIVTKLSFLQPFPAELNHNFDFIKQKIIDDDDNGCVTKCNAELWKSSSSSSEETRAAHNKESNLLERLQLLKTELAEKDQKLSMLKLSRLNQICELKQRLLSMEAGYERRYKKLVGDNLQLEEKLQSLQVKYEKLNLEKEVLKKELIFKEKAMEDLQHKLSEEEKSKKAAIDLHQEEIRKLKNFERARKNEYYQGFQNEITQLQAQVKESEQKNEEVQNKLRQDRDILYKKYEGRKKLIINLQEEKKELSEKLSIMNQKYQKVKNQLSETEAELEKKVKEIKKLLAQLKDEQTRLVPLQDKMKKQESLLQQEMKQNATLQAQLELAERQIKELKQLSENGSNFNQPTGAIPLSDYSHNDLKRKSKYSRKIIGDKENKDKPSRKSMRMSTALFLTEVQLSAKSNLDDNDPNSSTSTRSEFTQSSIISTPSDSINWPLPAGTGFQFLCEDEDGEFMNHSYLGDLKAGRCIVDDKHLKRISELQRRNTLCLPHLQSSYPAETQMHPSTDYSDDALKAGVAIDISVLRESNVNSKIPIKYKQCVSPSLRKQKPSHPARQNPRLSTPTRRSSYWPKINSPRIRNSHQNENKLPSTPDISQKTIFKTPSSIQRLFKRRPSHASKEHNGRKERHGSHRFKI